MKYIVGLGNPGLEYKATKHNIGFEVVKSLAKANHIRINKALHFSLVGKGRIDTEEVTLVLPQTFMNLSGKAVGELVRREVKDISDLVIVCDDINIELGRIRLKKSGSAGGHKGLESIIHTIGVDDFARLKIGIATELHKGDISNYVLSPFKRKDKKHVSHVIAMAVDAITCLAKEGIDLAMTKFNKRKIGTS